jgi:hypothetical protein
MANPIETVPQVQRDVAAAATEALQRAALAGALAQQRATVEALHAGLQTVLDQTSSVSQFVGCPQIRLDRYGNSYRCGKPLTRPTEIAQRRCDACRRRDARNAPTVAEARQQKRAAEERERDAKRLKKREEEAAVHRAKAAASDAAAEKALTEAAQFSSMFASDPRPAALPMPLLSFASQSTPKPLTYVPQTTAPLALTAPIQAKALAFAGLAVPCVSTVPAPAPAADTGDHAVGAAVLGADDMDVEYPSAYKSDSDEYLTSKMGMIDITGE